MSAPIPQAPPTRTPPGGLCVTCEHVEYCSYVADSPGGVWSCEEFAVRGALDAPAATNSLLVKAPPRPRRPLTLAVELAGLCSNCERAPTCSFPKPEGGVWHCEEYA